MHSNDTDELISTSRINSYISIDSMLPKIKAKVKQNKDIIYFAIIIFLMAMLAFSFGWILAKRETKKPLEIYYENPLSYGRYDG